jgi:putative Mg2+ transporter-C (MgtC) family protein
MPLTITWADVVLRLISTLIAGAVIGYNRGEHGKAAGLRTTILVCLAAAIAMLQVNFLLPLAGRPPNSFVMNDLMRFPLGILTGVGFIGGGAILRRGNLVTGVTTAATLWYVTVIGLCFGGGQVALGWIATAIGALVLWVVEWLEALIAVQCRARLTITLDAAGPTEGAIRRCLRESALAIGTVAVTLEGARRCHVYEVSEMRARSHAGVPAVVDALAREPGVHCVQWQPIG